MDLSTKPMNSRYTVNIYIYMYVYTMNHGYWTYVQQFSDLVKGGAHDFVNREISQQPSHRRAS